MKTNPQSPFGEEEAKQFADSLGFTNEPIVAEDVSEGTVYLWSGPKDNLIIYTKSRRIESGLNQTPTNVINKQLTNEAVAKISEDFLRKNFLTPSENISFSFFSFFKSAGVPEGLYQSDREEASIYQVNFSPVASEFKLLTLDPRSAPIYVWVLPDGTISKAVIGKNFEVAFSEEKYALKNYSEFTNSLNKAILVTLDDGNILLSVLPKKDVQKIIVEEIELVYLKDSSDSKICQPVFLLKGKARVQGYEDEVNAQLYLPALKNL